MIEKRPVLPGIKEWEEMTTLRHKGTSLDDGNILHHDCADSQMTIFSCKNSLNYALKLLKFCYMHRIPQ